MAADCMLDAISQRPPAAPPHVGTRFEREMESQRFTAQMLARHELEEAWRRRLEQTLHQYRGATTEYRKLLQEEPDGRPPSPDSALARARQAESEALMEYSRVLRIFTDLTIHGKSPEETPSASSEACAGQGKYDFRCGR